MSASPVFERESAVAMGCGGVLGIAWSVGLVAGLESEGVHLQNTDLWIGASAGAVVAARLAHGVTPHALLQEQTSGEAAAQEMLRPYSQADVDTKNQQLFAKVQGNLEQARQRIGAWALRSNTPPLSQRLGIIAQRLKGIDWPARALRIVAVDAQSGVEQVWEHQHGVPLTQAVTASCAVPGVWPTVPIGGQHYMDGGLRSMTNADLGHGSRRVLVISPQGFSDGNPVSGRLRAECDALQAAGSRVFILAPDPDCLSTIGPNILDPARCAAVAQAGMRQGRRAAADVGLFWAAAPLFPTPSSFHTA
jgi:NTE family protein